MKESVFSKMLRDDIKAMLAKPAVVDTEGNIIKRERNPHVYLIHDSYRSGKKPYDFYFVHYKNFYAIECKVCIGKSINFDCVTRHQVESLYEVEHSGPCGNGYIVINTNNYKHNTSLVIPVYNWTSLIKTYVGVKSLKIDYILETHSEMVNLMYREKINGHLHWNIRNGILQFERY